MTPLYDRPIDCLAPDGAAALTVTPLRPEGLDAALSALGQSQAAFIRASGFAAREGELALLPGPDGLAGALFGLGCERGPFVFGALARALPAESVWRLEPGDYDTEDAVLGFCLGAYRFDAFRPERAKAAWLAGEGRKPALLAGASVAPKAIATARAVWLARDLINTPANWLGPAELAAAAKVVADRVGAQFDCVTGAALETAYPAIAAVGRGSARKPVVALLRWQGAGDASRFPLISLCGKGVCFDTGGYDLKPSAGMLKMKKDMGGAASMLALAAMLMQAALPIRLELRLGCVENMISGEAMRPLDVLATRKGLTVEVGNTDAEGRLVLCDLLAEACESAPDWLIDAATLTGAARAALGPDLPALFCNNDALAAAILDAGDKVHDPLWRLPLWPAYRPWLKSKTASLNSVSSKPYAGAILAALFLERFVEGGVGWAHIDLYAWNDTDRAGRPEGGEAYGIRALYKAISSMAATAATDRAARESIPGRKIAGVHEF